MRQRNRFLTRLSASALVVVILANPGAGSAQTHKEGNMAQQNPASVEPAVAKALAQYDAHRDIGSLQRAGDEAARHDGETMADPAHAHARGVERLANWGAILMRFKRDIDPAFDPENRPTIRVVPPGPEGLQYTPGVDPKEVKDPALRERYLIAIKKNDELIHSYGFISRLDRLHRVMLEKAASSVADARHTLGLSPQDIDAALGRADIGAGDKQALLAASNT